MDFKVIFKDTFLADLERIVRLPLVKYYKVFYRVQPGSRTVEVLRCWDGRQESDPCL
jgi:plasmid stabilization system protein ParE